MIRSFLETLATIKIEHSIFALPFAFASAFLAAEGCPEPRILVLLLSAMVCARCAGMAFNRYIDADIDAKNPRTDMRSIPAGRLTKRYALSFAIISAILFVLTTSAINSLSFMLSPIAVVLLFGYSYTKRFTHYSHFVLGLVLGISPIGAWIAVRGELDLLPIILGLAVTLWTAGFDIIYSCQDVDFDKDEHLFSIPVYLGVSNSLRLVRLLHATMLGLLLLVGIWQSLGTIYWIGFVVVVGSLAYEHALVWNEDLSRINLAFFTMNGFVSIAFGSTTILSVMLG